MRGEGASRVRGWGTASAVTGWRREGDLVGGEGTRAREG